MEVWPVLHNLSRRTPSRDGHPAQILVFSDKIFKIKKEKVYSLKYKIDRYGSFLAFFSWVPLIGDILTLSLGFFKVNFKAVAFWIFIGKLMRFIVVALLIYNGIKIVS